MSNKINSPHKVSTEDLVKILMEKFDLHDGKYLLVPELTANIGPHRVPNEDGTTSGPHVGISVITTGYVLVPAPTDLKDEDGVWDAQVLNPSV